MVTTYLIKSKIFMHLHVQKSDVHVNQDTACAYTKTPYKYKDIFSIM